MSLEQLLRTGLPMNRKERFFTGTVLPMIVCAENFQYFGRLLDLIRRCPAVDIDPRPDHANIEFFSEYGFMESVYGKATKARFPTAPKYRDTPDILTLINAEPPLLIGLEAKMYDVPTAEALAHQMNRQREYVLDAIAEVTGVPPERIFQAAVVPQTLARGLGDVPFEVISWESILAAFRRDRGEDYFLAILRLALESYEELVSRTSAFDRNKDGELPGEAIERRFRAGKLEFLVMGRAEGLSGDPLREDIQSGRWRKQVYQVARRADPPNRNWFRVGDFVASIDALGAGDTTNSNSQEVT